MYGKKLGMIFVLSACLIIIVSGVATARPVNLVDYFAVGDIGSTPDEPGQEWYYQYTSGPEGPPNPRQFKVTLKGSVVDPKTVEEHRIYKRQNQAIDPVTKLPVFDTAGNPVFEESPLYNYLECNAGRRSISIVPAGTREGFNISSTAISRLKSGEVFEGERYAWVPHFRRGWYLFGDYYRSYLMVVVIDKKQLGDLEVNTDTDLDIPYDFQIPDYRVLGFSYFVDGVGEIYHHEYYYNEENKHIANDGDSTYGLVSTSPPAFQ